GRVFKARQYPERRNGTNVYVRAVRWYRGLQPGCLHPLYRRCGNWPSAQARFSRHAAPDALLRPVSVHGCGGLCHRGHSSAEMGVRTHRDAAGIAHNRTVLSADGAALSYALAITALCFSAATRKSAVGRVWERSIWMTLCVLGKQPQIIFVLLELMVSRLNELPRRWRSLAIVVLPGLILSPLWVVAVSADIAVWRLLEERNDSFEHFNPLWKLLYMWEHPYHFPLAAWTALSVWADRLWQELIGI